MREKDIEEANQNTSCSLASAFGVQAKRDRSTGKQKHQVYLSLYCHSHLPSSPQATKAAGLCLDQISTTYLRTRLRRAEKAVGSSDGEPTSSSHDTLVLGI